MLSLLVICFCYPIGCVDHVIVSAALRASDGVLTVSGAETATSHGSMSVCVDCDCETEIW